MDLSDMFQTEGDGLTFHTILSPNQNGMLMSAREKATGRYRTVVVDSRWCDECMSLHVVPTMLLLDRQGDVDRFDAPENYRTVENPHARGGH